MLLYLEEQLQEAYKRIKELIEEPVELFDAMDHVWESTQFYIWNNKAKDIIINLYKEDFERFGYERIVDWEVPAENY